jgi:hypothetical protein
MKALYTLLFAFSLMAYPQQILSERERAEVIDDILKDRLDNLLPKLMDETGFDMWILISREYNEDPVLKTMLPATWLNARRRTILVFYRNKEKNVIEKLAVARYNFGEHILSAWDKDEEPDQWQRLMQIIEEKQPKTIGLNYSTYFNICDGIVKTDYDEFMELLPKKFKSRVSSAEKLAIRWIETRTPQEMIIYNQLVTLTHDIIAEAFSEKVITPGVTTTSDVKWWIRDKITSMGLKTWFHPICDVQRSAESADAQFIPFPKDQMIWSLSQAISYIAM